MSSGYKILWTENALKELKSTFDYLIENWTEQEVTSLAQKTEKCIYLISQNPDLFQRSEFQKQIRRVVITKHNTP